MLVLMGTLPLLMAVGGNAVFRLPSVDRVEDAIIIYMIASAFKKVVIVKPFSGSFIKTVLFSQNNSFFWGGKTQIKVSYCLS